MNRRSPARLAVLAALLFVVLLIPQVVPIVYVNVVSRAAIFGILALSMNVLVGYTGQASLGHSAFLGVGAFASGYALGELGMPFGAAVAVAALIGAIAALVLGGVALRVTGLYLALVTIAFGLFAQETLFNIRSFTGGGAGQIAPRPALFEGDVAYAYFCIGVLALVLVFDWRLLASRPGRAIQALRDDERVAASWGINVTGHKLLAFVISGIIAGIGGALFASIEQIVSKEDFGLSLSISFLLMTVVGGAGNRWGVVQGGVLFAVLPTLLDRGHANFHIFPFTELTATWEPAIGALLLLLTLTRYPGGIAQQEGALLNWLGGGPFKTDPDAFTTAQGGMGARP
ncbi:MAG TPA: branched-chain amino acid ABC transporter permease [Acidimicrobiales bacterium]|nr:branched-chain amino acid ABC transporter permease [Acidimicrobiales bacterium]